MKRIGAPGILPVPGARSQDKAVYLPGRNLTLSVKAAVFCVMNEISELAIGSLDHNPFPDASPRFFQMWGKALRGLGLGAQPLRLVAPYRQLSKVEVIRRGRELGRCSSVFPASRPSARAALHCGRCNKCAERRRAFKAARVLDKTGYVH